MPGMPRIKGKPTKIAFKILGVPDNMLSKKTERQREIDIKLTAEYVQRSR